MDTTDVKQLIESGIDDATAHVSTRADHPEDDHFEATVISPAFEGEPLVDRHQLVYDALGEHMTTDIHAIELTTYTPEEHEG